MSGNTQGTLFRVTSFGESHGPAIGCVVDGCPPGLPLDEALIQRDLDARRPGGSRHVTQRAERDRVQILSGVYEGLTTGTPIALVIANEDARSGDYASIAQSFRPGHADYTYWHKYGERDPRGGGRASARVTAPAVAAGAIARHWLATRYGVAIRACVSQIGDVPVAIRDWAFAEDRDTNPLRVADPAALPALEAKLDALRKAGDSIGAIVSVEALGVPVGWGEPICGKLDADIAQAMMGINAVKGVEIGAGFASAAQLGSQHGDELTPQGFASNHAGGVLGGISTGQPITVRLAFKPTSSIRVPRRSITLSGEPTTLSTTGRHDPCVGLRAPPIARAMLALVLADHALRHRAQCADVRVATPSIAAREG